jgi:hypothetical protein
MTEKERIRIREIFHNPEYHIKRDAFGSVMNEYFWEVGIDFEAKNKNMDKLRRIMLSYLNLE